MKKLIAAASLCVASFSVQAAITVPKYDISAGKQIVEAQCAACHGVEGVSIVPAQPNLGGQNVKYLYKQLVNFKAGYRKNGLMQSQVANLSQQDLANVAGYYSNQAPWGVGFGNPATTQEASKLFLGGDKSRDVIGCAGCHGPDAAGNAWAAFPRLGGQHAQYIATQLKLFRAAGRNDDIDSEDQKRVNDAGKEGEMGMMQTVASRLSDRDIRILSDYVSAIH
ncbi:c-type cytochrome [Psychrobacter sp. LV10R520-6]|uniref:c-type cytochrome n=1 Tax=Psychrobacter sp. LV10R520-6 TaxID=1415574 RepID=UPI0024C525C7|nr:c-type cytochrome [Psychrobacter sp. LV10R520-6]SNT71418.1 Cytochrome c553 [Psychrobacter sp. LV10R520-6]